ncbi:Hypothetical protein D9617_36g063400 [Elsinoe fawcettii]|nr:Hypothetical protein D9617_36g063400 [Elsinoe fawcettii]
MAAAVAATPSLPKGAPNLAQIFGKTPEIGDLVKNFDFNKIDVRDSKSDEFLHADLAPSYGKLSTGAVKDLDEDLKIMIAGTMKVLEKLPDKKWESVLSAMMQNGMIEPDGDGIIRADQIIEEGTAPFKTDGSPDAAIVDRARNVKTWFVDKLIQDEDVIKSTRINIDVLANIVAQTGATVDSFEAFWAKHERHEQTVVDIGVMRFPDIDHPHFKLYRIKSTAWSDSSRVMFVQNDKNGITGEFNCKKFKSRATTLK